ncbi:RHS repeat-associated core domain-containing protein [Hamadaea sp. NPDC051192]|uniref:RHS repeat-associated core domain-containing protein n=1 Tax=Hamadaea sp. NPDC051192 TaxID=3154940 RepID=UPI003422F3EA
MFTSRFSRAIAGPVAAMLVATLIVTGSPAAAQDGFSRDPQPFESTAVEPVSGTASAFQDGAANWSGSAADAVGASGSGDWSATDLPRTGAWTHGGSSGGFTYSYGMRVPPAAGPTPGLSLAYASASHDGRTSGTNNQASWIGDGWSYSPSFIERTYVSCGAESEEDGNQGDDPTGDLCWEGDSPSLTISLNGASGSLVRDDETGKWRSAADANWRVERAGSAASAGVASTERWVVTTTDGMKHYFASTASSRLTVPVFGNHSGEACYQSGDFEGSRCDQAYRWMLDYSVDVHGNLLRYTYGTTTGRYAPAVSTDSTATYVREAWLQKIEYGLRDGSTAGPTAKVEFTTADRCLSDCRDASSKPKKDNWPDTPWELNCESSTGCKTYSPAFFSTKRLTGVATYVADGTSFRKVDSWALTHKFKDYGDAEQVVLWLAAVRHTGHVGGTATEPPVEFGGTFYENRVDLGEAWPAIWRPRLTSIKNETGGVTTINYSEPDCGPGNIPSSHHTNTRRCYPVKYTPEGLNEPVDAYFHKYVVRSIAEADAVGGGPVVWRFYDYSTAGGGTSALWGWNDAEFVAKDDRDWNQWRGYAEVTTRVGDPADAGPQQRTRTRYFRGFDGDKQPSGTRSVSVTDAQGNTAVDHRSLAGMVWETASYDDTTIIGSTTTWYWHSRTAVRTYEGGKVEAFLTGAQRTDSRTLLSGSSWRQTRSQNAFDAFGRVVSTDDSGDLAVTGDEKCQRITYADNSTAWIYGAVATQQTVSVTCAATPNLPADLLSSVRAYYDGNTTYTAAPAKGLMTKAETLDSWSDGAAVYATMGTSTFDALGRALTTTDALGGVTKTAYTPAGAGPVTQTTVTNAVGHVTTTTMEPAWGAMTKRVAPNTGVSTLTYDPLGRTTAVWTPGRDPATVGATKLFSYKVSQTEPSAVTTKELLPDETYLTSTTFYDSLSRQRQTQVQTYSGRLISQTIYDSYGRTKVESGPVFNNQSGPTDKLVWISPGNDVSRTEYAYDTASRVSDEIFLVKGAEQWRTSYRYGGSTSQWMTRTIAPEGGTSTATLADAQGRTVELRQYHDRGATGGFDSTTYAYTPRGDLRQVTDPAKNIWRFEYDLQGRQTVVDDPDTGITRRTYNSGGQLTSTVDGNGAQLSYAYDKIGRPTKVWQGAANTGKLTIERTYDGTTRGTGYPYASTHWIDGQAWKSEVRKYTLDGKPQQAYTYLPAAAGALAGTYWQSFTYHANGAPLTSTASAAGGLAEESMNYYYDALGQPTRVTGNGDDFGEGHVYVDAAVYSPYGQLLQRRLGDPDTVGGTTGQAWQTWIYEEGTGRLSEFYFDKDSAGSDTTGNNGVAALSYAYDDSGNVLSITDNPVHSSAALDPETQCFQYDYLQRLTQAWAQAGTGACAPTPAANAVGGPGAYWSTYQYDLTGNRVAETKWSPAGSVKNQYTYPQAGTGNPHQVTTVTPTAGGGASTAFTYDAAGNTIKIQRGTDTDALTWTPAGRVATITSAEGITKFFDGADGNRLLRADPNGDLTAWVAGYELTYTAATASVEATRYYQHGAGIVGVRVGKGDIQWMAADHHGSGQWIVNGDTLTATVRRYDPFGNLRSSSATAWPDQRGFIGGIDNTDIALTTVGAREYDPTVGRFISADPVANYLNPQQLNGYAYASNSPLAKSDPSGLYETQCSAGVSGCSSSGKDTSVSCQAGGYACTNSNGDNLGSCGAMGTCRGDEGLTSSDTTFKMKGGNELLITDDGIYLNGVPITGASDDPFEFTRDVLDTMEEFDLSNSGWDTIRALYLTCESSEKYRGCNGYSRALSDSYDVAMCATGEDCVDIEFCSGNDCEYVNAEDVLEAAQTLEGGGDGSGAYIAIATNYGLGGSSKGACSDSEIQATMCGQSGTMANAMQVINGCYGSKGAPNNDCLKAVVSTATSTLNSFAANMAAGRMSTNPLRENPKIWGNDYSARGRTF